MASEATRQLGALLALLEDVHTDSTYQQLWFDFRHITDELVFYGMTAQSAHLVGPLANLCYKLLFRHEVFDTFAADTRGGRLGVDGPAAAAASSATQPRQQRRLLALGVEARAQLPARLASWVKQLSYFLMHFPDVEGAIVPLRRLHRALMARRGARGGEVTRADDASRRDVEGVASRHAAAESRGEQVGRE